MAPPHNISRCEITTKGRRLLLPKIPRHHAPFIHPSSEQHLQAVQTSLSREHSNQRRHQWSERPKSVRTMPITNQQKASAKTSDGRRSTPSGSRGKSWAPPGTGISPRDAPRGPPTHPFQAFTRASVSRTATCAESTRGSRRRNGNCNRSLLYCFRHNLWAARSFLFSKKFWPRRPEYYFTGLV
jgi:hypothetical protein